MIIALLTDFGARDHYVGIMKGVILEICPEAHIIDLCHEIAPQNVISGAYLLETAHEAMPEETVIVAVVDPGVGSARRAIAARVGERVYVAPDNGLLWPLIERVGGAEAIVSLTERDYYWRPESMSATFHGRDVFAPVGAHIACGVSLDVLGERLEPDDLVRAPDLMVSADQRASGRQGQYEGCVVHVDHFGNLITHLRAEQVEGAWEEGQALAIVAPDRRPIETIWAKTFRVDLRHRVIAYVGSTGRVEIAIVQGSAAHELGLGQGARLVLRGAAAIS